MSYFSSISKKKFLENHNIHFICTTIGHVISFSAKLCNRFYVKENRCSVEKALWKWWIFLWTLASSLQGTIKPLSIGIRRIRSFLSTYLMMMEEQRFPLNCDLMLNFDNLGNFHEIKHKLDSLHTVSKQYLLSIDMRH